MVLDVAELLGKHRTTKAKGVTIKVTLSLQPLLRQILPAQPCPHRCPQHWAPQGEFLSELGGTSAHSSTAAAAQFGSGGIVIPDMLKHCCEVDCAFSHQHYGHDSELAALCCKHMKPLGQCIKH